VIIGLLKSKRELGQLAKAVMLEDVGLIIAALALVALVLEFRRGLRQKR
jgi:hypothetical protein